jgi:transglutaminase-like putative cysteine protease
MPSDDRTRLADADRFLASSKTCDAGHPAIEAAALSLARSGDSERDKAIEVFHFVRDEILFQFSRFSDRASDTLTSKRGHCYQKANLQIALLRCLGVPAGFITQRIDPEVLRPFLSDEAMKMVVEPVGHANAAVFLRGRWLSADATFDKPLLDFALDAHWQMQDRWDGLRDVSLPARLLIGEPSEPLAAIWIPDDLRDRTAQENLVLNQRLLEMRAQMEARGV